MTHPSPTALEEIRKRHDRDDVNEFTRRFFGPFHEDRAALLTHIAALEAENELVRRCYSGLKAFALDVSRDPLNHWSGAAQRLLDTGVYDRAEKAEAQLATRLPDREAIAAKLREWADTGESFEMKARWLHEWLLSGAATPAPTAALTDWEVDAARQQYRAYRLTQETTKESSEKYAAWAVGAASVALNIAETFMKEVDRLGNALAAVPAIVLTERQVQTVLEARHCFSDQPNSHYGNLLLAIIDSIAKSPPQGAEE